MPPANSHRLEVEDEEHLEGKSLSTGQRVSTVYILLMVASQVGKYRLSLVGGPLSALVDRAFPSGVY